MAVSKYKPDLLKIDLNNRRELLGEGVKGRNNICLLHKYPHLAPRIETIQNTSLPSNNTKQTTRVSTDFAALLEDPRDKLVSLDERLLMELVREYLHGPTITESVQKKVQQYLLHICSTDRHFRQQLLGGVPHSDALKFSAILMSEISRLLAPQMSSPPAKCFRLPVHRAVQQALATLRAN